jgi:hypothetical protein
MANLGDFGAELAAVDATDEPDTFLFHGHEFALPAKVSSLPALRFAYNAKQVVAAEAQARAAAQRARTPEAKAAADRQWGEVELMANAGLYTYLRDVITTPGDWERFEAVAAEFGADEEELMTVAQKIMAAVAARPTRRSSASPDGPSSTGPGSTGGSASPNLLEEEGPVQPAMGAFRPVVVTEEGTTPEGFTPLDLARAEILDGSASIEELVRSGG